MLHPENPFESSLKEGRARVHGNQRKFSILEKIKNEFGRVKEKCLENKFHLNNKSAVKKSY